MLRVRGPALVLVLVLAMVGTRGLQAAPAGPPTDPTAHDPTAAVEANPGAASEDQRAAALEYLAGRLQWYRATALALAVEDVHPGSAAVRAYFNSHGPSLGRVVIRLAWTFHSDTALYAEAYARGLVDPDLSGWVYPRYCLWYLASARHGAGKQHGAGPRLGWGDGSTKLARANLGVPHPGLDALCERLIREGDRNPELGAEAACLLAQRRADKGLQDEARALFRRALELDPASDGGYRAAIELDALGEVDLPPLGRLALAVQQAQAATRQGAAARYALQYARAGGRAVEPLAVLFDALRSGVVPRTEVERRIREHFEGTRLDRIPQLGVFSAVTSGSFQVFDPLLRAMERGQAEGRLTEDERLYLDMLRQAAPQRARERSTLGSPLHRDIQKKKAEKDKDQSGESGGQGGGRRQETGGLDPAWLARMAASPVVAGKAAALVYHAESQGMTEVELRLYDLEAAGYPVVRVDTDALEGAEQASDLELWYAARDLGDMELFVGNYSAAGAASIVDLLREITSRQVVVGPKPPPAAPAVAPSANEDPDDPGPPPQSGSDAYLGSVEAVSLSTTPEAPSRQEPGSRRNADLPLLILGALGLAVGAWVAARPSRRAA